MQRRVPESRVRKVEWRAMRIVPIACLSDNYAYLLVCPETREAAIVDPSEPEPVLRVLEENGGRSGDVKDRKSVV